VGRISAEEHPAVAARLAALRDHGVAAVLREPPRLNDGRRRGENPSTRAEDPVDERIGG
jgi:hypothetical protein